MFLRPRRALPPMALVALGSMFLFASPLAAQPLPTLLTTPVATNPGGGFLTGMLPSPAPDDDNLYLVARNGFVYRSAGNGAGPPLSFINISSLITQSGEGGLLSIAFHPGYGDTHNWVFLNYTNTGGNTVIGRITMDLSNPSAPVAGPVETVLTIAQDFSNHNGGQIRFGDDGMLYIAMGDGGSGNDPLCRAQDPSSLLGKMLRLDVNQPSPADPLFSIPPDNPFVGDAAVRDEIWASGLRNPWRFSIDPATGEFWIADVGQSAREEVNRVDPVLDAGANFGWPVREGDLCNTSTTFIAPCATAGVLLPACSDPSLLDPVHVYPTGVAGNNSITGGYVYRGSAIPALVGHYVFGDFGSGRVWALDPATNQVQELFQLGFGLTTFGLDRQGEILIGRGTAILRIEPEVTSAGNWLIYQ